MGEIKNRLDVNQISGENTCLLLLTKEGNEGIVCGGGVGSAS